VFLYTEGRGWGKERVLYTLEISGEEGKSV